MSDIHDVLRAARSGDLTACADHISSIEDHSPFLYAYYSSQLEALRKTTRGPSKGKQRMQKIAEKIGPAIDALTLTECNWQREGNQTIAAIESGQISHRSIVPHPRNAPEVISAEYERKNSEIQDRSHSFLSRFRKYQPLPPAQPLTNINHYFRKTQAIAQVEALIGLAGSTDRNDKIRWVDIACGLGGITNAVLPDRHRKGPWQIQGYDLQISNVEHANACRPRGRRFFHGDCYQAVAAVAAQKSRVHIISMFEFLEHLEDPLALLREVATVNAEFVICGSPLAQRMDSPYNDRIDPVHLWSFDRESYSRLGELTRLEVVSTTETRVGTYLGGLDWLTVIFGPVERFSNRRPLRPREQQAPRRATAAG